MTSALRRWWDHPTDYTWTTAYHRGDTLLRRTHIAVGTWCWLYAVLCLLGAHTPAGTPHGTGRIAAYGLAATAAAIGTVWIRGPFPSKNLSRVFVAYLEISATVALLMLSDPYVALPSAAALGVSGSYIATFHSPRLFLTHQVWAIAVIAILFVSAVTAPSADVVLACAYLIVLLLVLFCAPGLTQVLLLLLRRDAATAFYDPLTGLRNRRGLTAAVTDYGDRPGTATVMVIDLDNFKQVNDRYGHTHGDTVLRETANSIHAAFPPPAITGRSGGEEFIVLTHTDPIDAIVNAHTLRHSFDTHTNPGARAGATVSIGITHLDAATLTTGFDSACTRADAAMYTAKHAGGNTVHIDTTEHTPQP